MRHVLLLCSLLCACATSPLVRPDDPLFADAEHRLATTEEVVRREAASPEEAALFLQAESFYRYRFQLKLHGARSYAAQLAAAALDFGPFSAFASENGIGDLRLKGYDGAAQLYEAHLARFPESRLAPLALWRLGWAYRGTSIDGFPRESDDVFHTLEKRGDARLSPLATLALRTPWKSQQTAVELSIIPGLGQIYCGEKLNGAVRMTTAAAAAVAFILPLALAVRDESLGWQRLAISTAGFIALQVAYTTAYQDAQRAALEFDEREEAAFAAAHPEAP